MGSEWMRFRESPRFNRIRWFNWQHLPRISNPEGNPLRGDASKVDSKKRLMCEGRDSKTPPGFKPKLRATTQNYITLSDVQSRLIGLPIATHWEWFFLKWLTQTLCHSMPRLMKESIVNQRCMNCVKQSSTNTNMLVTWMLTKVMWVQHNNPQEIGGVESTVKIEVWRDVGESNSLLNHYFPMREDYFKCLH